MVTCICPTCDRREWIARAIDCFLAQDYADRELLIVDDGADLIRDLVPDDVRVRYERLPRRLTIGAKRNLACELARGTWIAHWDDDDWYPAWRLSRQVAALSAKGGDICGTSQLYYHDAVAGNAYRYRYAGRQPWIAGNTFLYTKAFWQQHRFVDRHVGEDSQLLSTVPAGRIVDVNDPRLCVASIHPRNTSPKSLSGPSWQPVPIAELQQILGDADVGRANVSDAPSGYRVALAADLERIEFVAFNHGHDLPRMRRWELPWALSTARLGNTMAVLDCTINPVNFADRVRSLYPDVQWRHWNPLPQNAFELPIGVPDDSFDRVFCINTLEHLVHAQRRMLIADLARKLKPGGRLLLTSDYYFDSSWSNPAFLQAGVMRADRGEFPGGWNKVTPREWVELCEPVGLVPLDWGRCQEPGEHDPAILRNLAPFPHGAIAGAFVKGRSADARGPRVMLALLTWNTRDVSADSVRAFAREARMLARLGCEPFLCVCDNGSTDGTDRMLRDIEPEIGVSHAFILNPENRGNSVARNQIIDCMLEWGADYLLLMDGDIEIVPGSSFAMLRHMEHSGHRLGCIGADYRGQSPLRAHTSPCLYSIAGLPIEEVNWVAWTQYGMFRRAVFDEGVRFDDSDPFKGTGWGFEDNDLAFQLAVKGFRIQYFSGMIYLHRAVHSSVRVMRQLGHDPMVPYHRRKQHVIDKWAGVPEINNGPLAMVRRVQMQL